MASSDLAARLRLPQTATVAWPQSHGVGSFGGLDLENRKICCAANLAIPSPRCGARRRPTEAVLEQL